MAEKKEPKRELDEEEEFDLSSLDVEPDSSGKPLPASTEVRKGPVDYAKATDELLAREGEVEGHPVEGEWQIRALEGKLGIQIDDKTRNDILAVIKDNPAEPQEALKKLKEAKYSEVHLQPVAELIDNLVEVYNVSAENIKAVRAEIAESVDNAEEVAEEVPEEIADDVIYKNSLFKSLDDSLKIPEVARAAEPDKSELTVRYLFTPYKEGELSKAAKAAKSARVSSENRPAERAKAVAIIKAIFDKIEQEAKANNGKISVSSKKLQKRVDWYVKEFGFDKALFDNSVEIYLQHINATLEKEKALQPKEEEAPPIDLDKEFGDQMIESNDEDDESQS